MNDAHQQHCLDHAPPPFWRSRFGIGWIVLAGIAGWFLWTEHRAHLFAYWPFAFLLACPLMQWAPRGHGGKGNAHAVWSSVRCLRCPYASILPAPESPRPIGLNQLARRASGVSSGVLP